MSTQQEAYLILVSGGIGQPLVANFTHRYIVLGAKAGTGVFLKNLSSRLNRGNGFVSVQTSGPRAGY